jgi:uncharacterized SAM-binding protein YcdF (DUF218 family)
VLVLAVPALHPKNLLLRSTGKTMDSLPPPVQAAALKIWDYMILGHVLPERVSLIMALGSNDPRVAERAADLYLEGRAPLILFSGGAGALTAGLYGGLSEAAYFAQIATARGVPADAILTEGKSTNTGENIKFSRALLEARGASADALILVQKPFMERRTLATFLAQWGAPPVPSFFVTSPRVPLRDYPIEGAHRLGLRDVIEVMCGDLQRVAVYPKRGFQAFQPIPQEVWAALKLLVREGYGRHMMRAPGAEGATATDPASFEGVGDAMPPAGP